MNYVRPWRRSYPLILMLTQTFTQKIQEQLISINKARKSVVLIIDEAQALPIESIEAPCAYLPILETESRKLMHVVLFAQPELDDKLNLPELTPVKAADIVFILFRTHGQAPAGQLCTTSHQCCRLSR